MPNDPNNKQRYLDYMELKDNGPNAYEGEDGYRALLKPPKDKGFAPNEGNTYSSQAKSDRQNTMPKKNGSQVIGQTKGHAFPSRSFCLGRHIDGCLH